MFLILQHKKMSKQNPFVFLDVSIDGDPAEKMVFELFSDVVPKTAENFRALCTGEKGISSKTGRPLHYKGSFFHRIVKGSLLQGGDFLRQGGSFGESIYGEKFPDEPPSKLKHDQRGLLSMALADRDARGSLFVITFKANRHLDRKYVVFGKLVQGYEVLEKIENVGGEDGRPSVTVKIINCGEFLEEKVKANKGELGKDVSSANIIEAGRRRKHKKSSKDSRKRRKRYHMSESDTSSDSEMESESDTDTESDSDTLSSSDLSSSSGDRRKKRRRYSKRDRYRRSKRRDKRRGKKHRRRDKRSKRRSRRTSDSLTDTESESKTESSSDDGEADVKGPDRKHKTQSHITVGNQSPLVLERASMPHKNGDTTDTFEREEGEFPNENGERRSNGIELEANSDKSADIPNVVDDHTGKSRICSVSPTRAMSKSMSVSPRKSMSRSPRVDKSPVLVSQRSRSISRTPVRNASRSPPARGRKGRSISRSPTTSPPQRNLSRTPPRTSSWRSSRRSVSRSPVRVLKRSLSRSPVRSSRKSGSRSSGRAPPSRRSPSWSPVRAPTRNNRRSYSRSPVSDRGRNSSRSPSPDGSPKRIRRGRGFSERFSYARRYRSPSPDRSPMRSYRYGSRIDRDRYYRRSPGRYRSPPRARTPPRYRSRRSRTRSPVSRSPIRYRHRRRYSPSPIRKRSPIKTSRVDDSPRAERRRSPSRSRSSSLSRSSLDSQSPKKANKDRSRSFSGSPLAGKKGLVSYEDASPDSGQR